MPLSAITPYALHIAAAIGALGLYLLIRPGNPRVRTAGTLLGVAGAALFVAAAIRGLNRAFDGSAAGSLPVVPAVMGLIAIAGAARMVTHPKPVFAALYFILVVVSTAGMFLALQAEFMAFALIIVYAGAILITYMFVLMLAQQSPTESVGDVEGGTNYDRVPREPIAAIAVGFLLLATLGDSLFSTQSELRHTARPATVTDAAERTWRELEAMPRRLDATVSKLRAGAVPIPFADGRLIHVAKDGSAMVHVQVADGGVVSFLDLPLSDDQAPTNTQSVGLALVSSFPASLELASVILLMAMFGAVVLARKQIELGDDERREAAGMRRISMDDPDPPSSSGFTSGGSTSSAATVGGTAPGAGGGRS
ncbi:MAG: NADH-quinone oxidoreductase subunit J [Phycisphaerae bacterium]|nr:NADH-quinone oxidoreductase subunit J [Phycisphaerae bacterium]